MKFKNYYYLDKTVEPFSYVDLGGDTKISGSRSGVSINKDLHPRKFKMVLFVYKKYLKVFLYINL